MPGSESTRALAAIHRVAGSTACRPDFAERCIATYLVRRASTAVSWGWHASCSPPGNHLQKLSVTLWSRGKISNLLLYASMTHITIRQGDWQAIRRPGRGSTAS